MCVQGAAEAPAGRAFHRPEPADGDHHRIARGGIVLTVPFLRAALDAVADAPESDTPGPDDA